MTETEQQNKMNPSDLDSVESKWGTQSEDNFGYASEEERRASRGLEDWEMVDRMSDSQPGVFTWFRTVVGSVVIGIILFVLFAYALNYFMHHFGMNLLGKG